MTLMEYDLTFVHRKGSYNVVADALSRLKRRMSPEQRRNAESELTEPTWINALTTTPKQQHNSTTTRQQREIIARIGVLQRYNCVVQLLCILGHGKNKFQDTTKNRNIACGSFCNAERCCCNSWCLVVLILSWF